MAKTTKIEWTDATWSPWYGCTPVSAGCRNCYAKRNWRLLGLKPGEVRRAKDATFYAPLKWKEPRKIFVCSLSDFFHKGADPWRNEVFDIISQCQQHTFIIPTKRTERMIECIYLREYGNWGETKNIMNAGNRWDDDHLPNVWFLASVENQEMADKRIPELLRLREYGNWKVLGLSVEPMLGEIHIEDYLFPESQHGLDWVICGGESGPNARPCHPDWVRSLRDQCKEAGVPFFFKQWGEWQPTTSYTMINKEYSGKLIPFIISSSILRGEEGKTVYHAYPKVVETDYAGKLETMHKVGKKAAGRLLDGKEWSEYPK